ncbi:uncharacterized protein [Salminus brasiliensis]|uniref:uncharacterized protein isoform X2 n=1 Tax=Salminus brasiliensis TaxID=930266 RepID=UPI003B8323FF
MACAQQSAAEYLRNARADLVTRLRNFPLITENLYQRKVLNGSEVDALKAERRNFDKARFILDCVSKKGEGASYELLRILDITRKRTLHQDSHHWICCFPFREDTEADYSVGTKPCHDYQKRLKTKAQNILRRQREQCRDRRKHKTEGKFTFVPVVLDTDTDGNSAQSKIKKKNNKCKKLRHKKLRSYLPVQKQKLSPDDLLHSREKAILLIGKPGIGKTSVVQEMLSIWSQKDSRALDYMFYFDEATLTQISSFTSLESLLFDLYCNPLEKDRKEVWQDIEEHSENVIIVFDGINTTQKNPLLQKILDGDLLPEAKIVITCRSELEDDSFLSDWPACEIYVQGFSEESVRIYLAYMLSSEAEIFLNNQELISLCHVPMYAFMVATCSSFSNLTAARHPLTITEMYVHILRQDLKKAGNKTFRQIDQYMKDIRDQLFSLMESAFSATLQKTVNLPNIDSDEIEISKVFLKKITVKATPTSVKEFHAFLHSTVQEFFSALWLLGNPDEIDKIFQLSLEKEKKHLKHLIPFLCGLLSQQNLDLLKNLFSEDKIRRASDGFFLKVMNTFVQHDEDNDEEDNSDAVFVCQCLYESQSPEACLLFLEKIHFHLDLSGQYLDPHQCCAVSYVISQSNSKQVILTLKDCDISDSGIQMILRITSHLTHLRATPSILCQIWISALGCEFFQNVTTLLDVCGKQMHLPVFGEASVFGNAGRAIGESSEKINLHLHCRENAHQLSDACPKMIFQALSQKHSLRFELPDDSLIPAKIFESIQRDLVLRAAVFESNGQQSAIVSSLLSSFYEDPFHVCNFLIKLQSLVKTDAEFHCLKIIYGLIPAVWIVDLSERKSSLFLEVLKLQTVQKPVELRGWSDEESEMKSFLQCLPYISQLSFRSQQSESNEWRKRINSFLLDLCLQAAFHQEEPVETVWKLMSNAHAEVDDFRLDLYSHVKNFESQTGRSVLPAIQQVFQSVFTLWMIDLSERKSSLFLEVLKLQTEKKPVVLRGWSDEESELRSFLQCLPFISQLSFFYFGHHALIQFLVKLTLAAAEFDVPTGQRFTRLLTSVCTYTTFPFNEYDYVNNASAQCEFLLDLFSHVKEYETETGRSVLPALQPIYQSAPVVWIIDFSERKSSHFLEVLKLQTVHKPVELWGWSDKESEVLSFLQCLPFISRLSFISPQNENEEWRKRVNSFLLDLCLKAALHQKEPAETVKKLMSCAHGGVEDFLLDLFSHVKEYETETGRSVLPALQPVYQSVPEVWIIDLSERKSSAFLEVLKLQTVKKPVVLRGWSDEESEVRSFLQCLPYISQLRFLHNTSAVLQFLVKLIAAAAECDTATRQNLTKLLTSVCTQANFSLRQLHFEYGSADRCHLFLDLYSNVKNYETETGRNVLPVLQSVYQSAPEVWYLDLSQRKSSLFLEVLRLQTGKKAVVLRGWSDDEGEVRSFLQCLPYISQLSFTSTHDESLVEWRKRVKSFLLDLCLQAALHQNENIHTTVEELRSCAYGDEDNFLLDLFSHVKKYETETGRSVLPALQPVYQSGPALWNINLSERKSSLLLEVLKLQTVKKPVELKGWSDEESEVRCFLQCLPFISQLRFSHSTQQSVLPFLVKLIVAAAECDMATGQSFIKLLTSVCTYTTFPFEHGAAAQCNFLLDLYSQVKVYESQTGRSVLPALQPVYQSAPAVWNINLSERKSSLLLEVLKLQTVKKPVELRGWSDEESEVRSFLQCLPFISQLSGAEECFLTLCKLSWRTPKAEQVAPFLQALGFTLSLEGNLPTSNCRAVGRVLGLSASRLNLTLNPQAISLRGTRVLFRHITHLHTLKLSGSMVVKMVKALRAVRASVPVSVEELSFDLSRTQQSVRELSRVLSSLASLLRLWNVQCVNLFEHTMEVQSLIVLLCHQGSLTIRLSKEALQQLLVVVYEAQEEEFTQCFLQKVGGDLTPCSLNWKMIQYFLQYHCVTVDFRKSNIKQQNIRELLTVLDRVQLRSLLSSAENFINLNSRDLDSVHWAALCFTLQHCSTVSLSLLWTSIPEGELERIVPLLNHISNLSVDRLLLLRLLHCCSVSEGTAAAVLLSALQHRLDFSCSSTLDLTAHTNTLTLSTEDCRVISTTIQRASTHTQLSLQDCEIEDAGVEQLITIVHKVSLSCSKALLLQFLTLVHVGTESECVRRAVSLSRALGEEVDLSHTPLDLQACRSLALVLEHCEGLSELDLSHCQLTDHCLELLLPHLHKISVLDLNTNHITDHGAGGVHRVVSSNSHIQTVRLFNNGITQKQLFMSDQRFEMW